MIESEADRLAMVETFGVSVTVRGRRFKAISDSPFFAVSGGDVEVESRNPSLTCLTSDVEKIGISKGDAVDGLGQAYRVLRHEPDGTGMSVLVLQA